MTNRPPPTLAKWPFILTDVTILVGIAWLIRYVLPPKTTLDYVAMLTFIALWMVASWYAILPWIKEYQAHTKFSESEALNTAVEQISRLEEVGARVQTATASWQSAQDAAVRVTNVARDIEERMKADSKEFMEFAERVNNEEKQHLRLEVDKLRRSEAEWLQVTARILDHTFALTAAALRSGQPNLATQMTNFQNACRDSARRVGLVAFHPAVGEAFDERSQQLEDANAKLEAGAVVSDVLATGYTFQGQLLRKALVRVSNSQGLPEAQPAQDEVAANPPESLESEQNEIERAQAALAEVAEEVHEQRRDNIEDSSEQAAAVVEENATVAVEPIVEEVVEVRNVAVEQPSAETKGSIEDFVVDTYRPSPSVAEEESATVELASREEISEPAVEAEEGSSGEHFAESSEEESHAAPADEHHESEAPATAPKELKLEEKPVEVASSVAFSLEADADEKPRRRQRKPDPQSSLPF